MNSYARAPRCACDRGPPPTSPIAAVSHRLHAIDATKCKYKYHKLSHVDDPRVILLRHGSNRSDVRLLRFPDPLRPRRRLLGHFFGGFELELLNSKKRNSTRFVEERRERAEQVPQVLIESDASIPNKVGIDISSIKFVPAVPERLFFWKRRRLESVDEIM